MSILRKIHSCRFQAARYGGDYSRMSGVMLWHLLETIQWCPDLLAQGVLPFHNNDQPHCSHCHSIRHYTLKMCSPVTVQLDFLASGKLKKQTYPRSVISIWQHCKAEVQNSLREQDVCYCQDLEWRGKPQHSLLVLEQVWLLCSKNDMLYASPRTSFNLKEKERD